MKIPRICQDCDGMGGNPKPPKVIDSLGVWAITVPQVEPCKSCEGAGIIWEGEEE